MRMMMIREFGDYKAGASYIYDFKQSRIRGCSGCLNCCFDIPGICSSRDMNDCCREFLRADKVIIFSRLSMGVISIKMKQLLDCLMLLTFPDVTSNTGAAGARSKGINRSDIEIYYDGSFASDREEQMYRDYFDLTFCRFHNISLRIEPVTSYQTDQGVKRFGI